MHRFDHAVGRWIGADPPAHGIRAMFRDYRALGGTLFGTLFGSFGTIARSCFLGTIAGSRGFLFYLLSATCTLLSAASATRADSKPADTCHQAGNTEPGQHLFQIFLPS